MDHGVKVEWSAYLHLLLHAIFIGNSLLSNIMDTCIGQGQILFSYFGLFSLKSHDLVSLPLLCRLPGFDHQHPEVYEHCKRLLLHLLVVQGANSNVQSVAMVLLRNRDYNEPRVLTVKPVAPELNLTGQFCCDGKGQ